eukprot:COSAG03_NODE_8415_length_805_cov_4.958924_1_plen_60_part_10
MFQPMISQSSGKVAGKSSSSSMHGASMTERAMPVRREGCSVLCMCVCAKGGGGGGGGGGD